MVNELPTIFEVVNGKNKVRTSGTNHSSTNKSKSNSKVEQRASESQTNRHTKATTQLPKEEEDNEGIEEEGDGEDGEEHGETLCGACGDNYASDEFWICCDVCEKWFHGKCVKITPARAEHIKQYKCPSCSTSNKRTRPS